MKKNFVEEIMLNGCEDVLEFLHNSCDSYKDSKRLYNAFFEGDHIRVESMEPEYGNICWGNKKYPDSVFFVGKIEFDGYFPVFCFKNGGVIDTALGVLLPAYCREELIATAKGDW